jgi:hypothetical protein
MVTAWGSSSLIQAAEQPAHPTSPAAQDEKLTYTKNCAKKLIKQLQHVD